MKPGEYVARDRAREPRVVYLVRDDAISPGIGALCVYHELSDSADPPLTCCLPAEFVRWYRPRRQFLFWKERI